MTDQGDAQKPPELKSAQEVDAPPEEDAPQLFEVINKLPPEQRSVIRAFMMQTEVRRQSNLIPAQEIIEYNTAFPEAGNRILETTLQAIQLTQDLKRAESLRADRHLDAEIEHRRQLVENQQALEQRRERRKDWAIWCVVGFGVVLVTVCAVLAGLGVDAGPIIVLASFGATIAVTGGAVGWRSAVAHEKIHTPPKPEPTPPASKAL